MKNQKRTLALILAMVLLVAVYPLGASAADKSYTVTEVYTFDAKTSGAWVEIDLGMIDCLSWQTSEVEILPRPVSTQIENGHKIATVVEDMIQERFNIVATIHIEPL